MRRRSPELASLSSSWELGAESRTSFRRKLLAWYRKSPRDLPWRRTRDPFAIWVSEVMLQQTQVKTVVPYYRRFLETFPTIETLAAADEQQVLKLWEGLGYYRRARQLHAAAREIMGRFEGKFPRDYDVVRSLPGIGRYTAGAVLSFAWDQPHPILEANTIRLFSRLLAYREDPTRPAGQRVLWEVAAAVVPRRRPGCGEVNQALIELGSQICTPRDPNCGQCPVARWCAAYQQGLESEIPTVTRKLSYEARTEVAIVIRKNGRVLLRECQPGERWAGLWDFPRFEVSAPKPSLAGREASELLEQQLGYSVALEKKLTTIKHGVTKYRITLHCFVAKPFGKAAAPSGALKWIRERELAEYPLSVTGRKISRLLAAESL